MATSTPPPGGTQSTDGLVLFGMAHSHPVHAVRLMLEYKGLEHRVVNLMPGLHPPIVRALGFRGGSVPALKIGRRRLQGTRRIARALEVLAPEPPLFPADPAERAAVQEAERWGEEVLQPIPRRVFRWALQHRQELRHWMADEVVGLPAPGVAGAAFWPIGALFARISAADEATVRADLSALPHVLDHCDALIAAGVIGGAQPNAADCQILASVRLMAGMTDLDAVLDGRPCRAAALSLRPSFPGPIPRVLPPDWIVTTA